MAYLNGRKIFSPIQIHTEGVTPTGTINITENGIADVTNYASANVNVETYENEINAAYADIIGVIDNE